MISKINPLHFKLGALIPLWMFALAYFSSIEEVLSIVGVSIDKVTLSCLLAPVFYFTISLALVHKRVYWNFSELPLFSPGVFASLAIFTVHFLVQGKAGYLAAMQQAHILFGAVCVVMIITDIVLEKNQVTSHEKAA